MSPSVFSFRTVVCTAKKDLIQKKRFGQFLNCFKTICIYLSFLLATSATSFAQDILVGLTSVGGQNGAGTAFSIKTTGSNFLLHRNFLNAGYSPHGDLVKGADGYFYGMTSSGGTKGYGTIFKISSSGTLNIIKNLDYYTTGAYPYGSLILNATDGSFYGLTSSGGAKGYGVVFKITPTGTLTIIKSLDYYTTGGYPSGSLIKATDGNFYGLTQKGGTGGYGTVFKVTPTGTFTVLKNLATTTGIYPYGSLAQGNDGNFYGVTYQGGTNNYGTIFKITPTGTLTVLHNLNYTLTDGSNSTGSLIKGNDGNFYGLTYYGGSKYYGAIFRITPAGSFKVFGNLDYYTTGGYPRGNLLQGADGNFYGLTSAGGTNGNGTIFKVTPTGSITVLRHLKNTTDGSNPYGSLYKSSDGYFYGLTYQGGTSYYNGGTVFKISSTGSGFAVLARFPDDAKGIYPQEGLLQAKDGYFYGTTQEGGTYGYGTIFKLCTSGYFATVRSLELTVNGGRPKGSLVQGTDGYFYGTTYQGGSKGYGTILKISPAGAITVLKHLDYYTTGGYPEGSLVQGDDGNFYGTTVQGGANNYGVIFKISPTGTFTVLRSLSPNTDGYYLYGSLVKGNDGNFYGLSYAGGPGGYGTIFKITPTGTFTVIKSFSYSVTGGNPYGNSLLVGKDGNFYGLTTYGGTYGYGTAFKITPTGTLTVLHNFSNAKEGGYPRGNLAQASDGAFYGFTSQGGTYNGGTIFKLTSSKAFTVLRHLNPATDGGTPLGSLVVQKADPKAVAQSITDGEDAAKAITLTGIGGTPLTYTISTLPKNGTLTGTGAIRTYTPKANYAGRDSFYFTTTWGCQTSSPAKVYISITQVNDAPVLNHIGNKTVVKGSKLTFTATATDVDAGQTKTYSLVNAPSGASIGTGSGVFSWTPATAGSFTFTVKVTDNGSPRLSDTESITVTVTNPPAIMAERPITDTKVNSAERRLIVTASPNPSPVYFTVNFKSNNNEPVSLKIIDATGRTVEVKSNIAANGSTRIGDNYRPGFYFIEALQGNERVMLKLVKSKQ